MNKYSNEQVRRQDRLLAEVDAFELLANGEYGILSLVEQRADELAGYGIPLNYVWDSGDYIYIHCAPEGLKLKCIAEHPKVSFTVVGRTNVVSDKFTTGYESIVVRGRAERSLPTEERMKALKLFIEKYSPNDIEVGLKYAEKSFHRTEIVRIAISSISGKTKRVE